MPRDEGCGSGELRVSGFSSFLVFGVPKKFSGGAVTAAKHFSHRRGAVTTKEKDVVRDFKERERVLRAFLSCAGWRVSFEILVLDMLFLWNEGVPSFPLYHTM